MEQPKLVKNVRFKDEQTHSHDLAIYDNKIYELVEAYFENKSCEFLETSKNMIQLEEKEYMNQVITTTTIKTVKTSEDLFTLFDNAMYEAVSPSLMTPTNIDSKSDLDRIFIPIHIEEKFV